MVSLGISCRENAPSSRPVQNLAATDSSQFPFPSLPAGVILQNSHRATQAERDAIGNKLNGSIKALTNSDLTIHGSPIQVNIIRADDDAAAAGGGGDATCPAGERAGDAAAGHVTRTTPVSHLCIVMHACRNDCR